MDIYLFNNETIRLSNEHSGNQVQITDEGINEKYLKGEVRIITEQARYPLDTIKGMIDSKKYNLNPEFQRRHRWTDGQKSRLIESFIMNVPIPPIFLYEVKYSNYEVMDGLQRLSTIYDFYDDKFELRELEYWKELEGRKYSSLPEEVRLGIDRRYLSSIILLKETAKSKEEEMQLKQIVFERINSGGTKLEYQESRNALYPGAFNDLCIRLARHNVFCKIFQIPAPDELEVAGERPNPMLEDNDMYCKMRDVETVMRFFAMRHVDKFAGRQKDFFDRFTEAANQLPLEVLNQYEELFDRTIKLAYNLFGNGAFGLWKQGEDEAWTFSPRPNVYLYDPIMVVLSQMLEHEDALLANKEAINGARMELYIDNPILRDGRQTSKSAIENRMDIVKDFLGKYV